jgi:hypothetical protein
MDDSNALTCPNTLFLLWSTHKIDKGGEKSLRNSNNPRNVMYASPGLAWISWATSEEMNTSKYKFVYGLTLHQSKFVKLLTKKQVTDASKKYGAGQGRLDWKAMKDANPSKGGALVGQQHRSHFAPTARGNEFAWYWNLDVPSAIIWDKSAIKQFVMLSSDAQAFAKAFGLTTNGPVTRPTSFVYTVTPSPSPVQ